MFIFYFSLDTALPRSSDTPFPCLLFTGGGRPQRNSFIFKHRGHISGALHVETTLDEISGALPAEHTRDAALDDLRLMPFREVEGKMANVS